MEVHPEPDSAKKEEEVPLLDGSRPDVNQNMASLESPEEKDEDGVIQQHPQSDQDVGSQQPQESDETMASTEVAGKQDEKDSIVPDIKESSAGLPAAGNLFTKFLC